MDITSVHDLVNSTKFIAVSNWWFGTSWKKG